MLGFVDGLILPAFRYEEIDLSAPDFCPFGAQLHARLVNMEFYDVLS